MDRWTFYPNPYASQQTAIRTLQYDEKRKATVNFRSVLDAEHSTVESVAWVQRNPGIVTISGETHDGLRASAFLKGTGHGRDRLACRATLGDGQIVDFRFDISVKGGILQ